jgi:hypothetical protein
MSAAGIARGRATCPSSLFAIEPAIRPRSNPGDADHESAKDYSGNRCLSERISLPETKQGGAHGDYAE